MVAESIVNSRRAIASVRVSEVGPGTVATNEPVDVGMPARDRCSVPKRVGRFSGR